MSDYENGDVVVGAGRTKRGWILRGSAKELGLMEHGCMYTRQEGEFGALRLRFSDGVGGLSWGSAMIPRRYESGCHIRINWICTQS